MRIAIYIRRVIPTRSYGPGLLSVSATATYHYGQKAGFQDIVQVVDAAMDIVKDGVQGWRGMIDGMNQEQQDIVDLIDGDIERLPRRDCEYEDVF